MQRILIIEDEVDIAELISFNLTRAGYEALVCHDGTTGLQTGLKESPDLIILDLMLPGRDGFSVLKELRRDNRTSDTPVIMLTAKAQTEDRIRGLEAGADDYLTKPFSPKELLLRVQSVLRRSEAPPGAAEFSFGPFRFDKNNVKFYADGEPVDLTSTEFKLLLYLCERPGKVQDRNDLLRTIWGYSSEVHSRTLDTHMKRLRQKLEGHADLVETVRGVGYLIRAS
jgi:two-component system, OmpR family, phosphate regulon response regulator PhoB